MSDDRSVRSTPAQARAEPTWCLPCTLGGLVLLFALAIGVYLLIG